MIYSVPCECGNRIEVTPVQAGTEIVCDCGQKHNIPLLSELRQMMGQTAYQVGIVGEINRMIRDGELPWGDTCAISGLQTSDSYKICVQYEFTWAKGPRNKSYLYLFFILLLLPIWFIWLFVLLIYKAVSEEESKILGHEKEVWIPLRVRKEYHDRFGRTRSQHKLRRWLRTVPVYDQLFREYPKAKIFT